MLSKSQLKSKMPVAWNLLRTTRLGLRLLPRLYGFHPRTCNICGHQGRFLAEIHFPDIFTYDALCPKCGSLPRNRLLRLAIEREGLLKPTDRLLHFAPEKPVRGFVEPMVGTYQTTDLDPKAADMVQDIEAMTLADSSYDVAICSHVLEHVDHVKALGELYRVLAPGGRLLALFPVVEGWDGPYENAQVASEGDRAVHFGKHNHRRRFGRDVRRDFEAAGFRLQPFAPDGETCVRLGLIPGETLFIARKDAVH